MQTALVVQSEFKCFAGIFDEFEGKAFFCLFGDFDEVFSVPCGEDDGFNAGLFGGEDFFLQAANGQDQAAKSYLAGHSDFRAGGFAEQQ